mgnify:CR=1 FL=1
MHTGIFCASKISFYFEEKLNGKKYREENYLTILFFVIGKFETAKKL